MELSRRLIAKALMMKKLFAKRTSKTLPDRESDYLPKKKPRHSIEQRGIYGEKVSVLIFQVGKWTRQLFLHSDDLEGEP